MEAYLALAQGVYFLISGVWPLLSIRTFMRVTGPKLDLWLVKTVGVLVAVIGAVLILAGVRDAVTAEVATLAVGCAAGLAAIDTYYVSTNIIAPVYLLDAVAESLLIALWLLALAT